MRTVAAATAALVLLFALPAGAHTAERALREIVMVRGQVLGQSAACGEGLLVLNVVGRNVRLCGATVRRVVVASPEVAAEPVPEMFDLQGERERLAVATGAAPGARLTVLGEWRPGRVDLFLIEIDVCACPNDAPGTPEKGTDNGQR